MPPNKAENFHKFSTVAPARSEAGGLVVPSGNYVRIGTLEALPVYNSNIAPVQAESSGGTARRAFPIEALLRRGLHHHAPVSVRTKGAFDFDRSLPCRRKHCAIVQLHLWIPFHHGPKNALPSIPTHLASFIAHHIFVSLLDCSRWMVAVVRCLLPRSYPVASR